MAERDISYEEVAKSFIGKSLCEANLIAIMGNFDCTKEEVRRTLAKAGLSARQLVINDVKQSVTRLRDNQASTNANAQKL
jgi:hypothetical protein